MCSEDRKAKSHNSPKQINLDPVNNASLIIITNHQSQFGERWSTNEKVICGNVDPPKWTFYNKLYFGRYWVLPPKFFTHITTPKLYFQSDLGRRAASCWALPHISSYI